MSHLLVLHNDQILGKIKLSHEKLQSFNSGLSDLHKQKRVNCALNFLEDYGFVANETTDYGRMVITDESSGIKQLGKLNSAQDRVWSISREVAGQLLDFQTQKFDAQYMIWYIC